MDVKTSKAAILVELRKPMVIDEFTLPDSLQFGQVLVHVHTSSICGAQINEIELGQGTGTGSCPICWVTKPWPP